MENFLRRYGNVTQVVLPAPINSHDTTTVLSISDRTPISFQYNSSLTPM